MKVFLAIGLISVVTAVTFGIFFMGVNNQCVQHEQVVKAQYEQNQNNYDNYFKKLKEVAQVPDMYTKDLKDVYASALKGRYGADGSGAVFLFVREHNPNFDSSLYKQIQQVIEAGRNDFETNQKLLIDKKRVYETYLGQFPSGAIARSFGFPRIKLEDFGIVTSDETRDTFKTKTSEPFKVR